MMRGKKYGSGISLGNRTPAHTTPSPFSLTAILSSLPTFPSSSSASTSGSRKRFLLLPAAAIVIALAVLLLLVFGDLAVLSSWKRTKCSSRCSLHGTCNEELGRCDCLEGYSGKDCSSVALPACHFSNGTVMPCWLPSSCDCALQCERFLLPHPDVCFEAGGSSKATALLREKDLNRLMTRHRLVRMVTDGLGHEVQARERMERNKELPWLTTSDHCPLGCSNRGLCSTTFGECSCAWYWGGVGCEVPAGGGSFPCLNDCSARGECVGGVCRCDEGSFGADCSLYLDGDGRTNKFDNPRFAWAREINPYMQQDAKLKVFVYELPPEFNMWQLQHVPYIDLPEALWFYERLLASPHRTVNADEADFFYVPLILRNRDTAKVPLLYEAIKYIAETWPYWNQKGGADHIFFVNEPWGKCHLGINGRPDPMLKNSITLSPWGFRGNMLTRGPEDACFIPGQDIVVPPSLQRPLYVNISAVRVAAGEQLPERTILMVFKGHKGDTPPSEGHAFSFGARQKVFELFEGKEEETGFKIINADEIAMFNDYMEEATFCLATAAYGFHSSTVASILAGCIPVIIQPNVTQPFEGDGLDWPKFSVSVTIDEIPRLPEILRGIPPEEIKQKQEALHVVWPSFTWTSPHFNPIKPLDFKVQSKLSVLLERRDAFSTIMHALARRVNKDELEDFMLPPQVPKIALAGEV